MLQDPNPTDYPELEKFCDWLYENYSYLPQDFESLKKAQVEYSALCAIAEAADSLNKRVVFTAATGSPVQIANDKLCKALIALAKLRS